MTAKEHLISLRTLEAEIQSIKERKLKIYERLRGGSKSFDDIRVQPSQTNTYEDKVIEFCDVSLELDEAERKLNLERQFAESIIAEIYSRPERIALRYYYIIGLDNQEAVARKMDYSIDSVKKILAKGVKNYGKLYTFLHPGS